ncbi:membrane protein insertion efficiency factor YidD [Flagellimonas sp.]|uniref:membrane protein insertion efficiency factor YidD n=1 Tax=Flagellimonas sp. TaxID=2058762 RepID=UPI003BAF0C56
MRLVLLIGIRLYWFFIPKSKRKCCIFQVSCSQYVYKTTSSKGFCQGIKALIFRYQNCRYGYEIFENAITNKIQLILPNKEIIDENEISTRVVNQYKKELLTIVNHYEKQ